MIKMKSLLPFLIISISATAFADTQDYIKRNVILIKSDVAYIDAGEKDGVIPGEPYEIFYDGSVVASGKIAWSDANISRTEPLDSTALVQLLFAEPLVAKIRLFVTQANRGGFLNIAYFIEPNLLPAEITLPDELMIGRLIHRGLITRNADGLIEPDLCGDYEIRDLTYTFYLRPDARFHSGKPVEASDVMYSFEQLAMAPSLTNASCFVLEIKGAEEFRNGLTSEIGGIFLIDNKTLSITLKRPFPAFEDYLIGPAGYIVPKPGNISTGTNVIGTGPYRMKWRDADDIVLEPFESNAFLDSLRFVRYKSAEEAGLSFELGRLDFIQLLGEPPPRFVSRGDYSSQISVSNAYVILGVNNDRSFQAGGVLGKALSFLLDRTSLIRVILGGSAALPTYDISAGKDMKLDLHLPFQPDSADYYLGTLSAPPTSLNLGVDSRFPILSKVAGYIEGQLQNKGIMVNENKMDMRWGYKSGSFLDLDLYLTYYIPVCTRFDCRLYPLLSQKLAGHTNILNYNDEPVQIFLENLRSDTDPARRESIAMGLAQSLLNDPPFVALYQPFLTTIYKADVSGLAPNSAGYVDLRKVFIEYGR